jgi:hypothetical protein
MAKSSGGSILIRRLLELLIVLALWMTASLASLVITTYGVNILINILFFDEYWKSLIYIDMAILIAAFLALILIFCCVRFLGMPMSFVLVIVGITSMIAAVANVWPAPNLLFFYILVGIITCCLLTIGAMRISKIIVGMYR